MQQNEESFKQHILSFVDPYHGQPLGTSAKIEKIQLIDNCVGAHIVLRYPLSTLCPEFIQALEKHWKLAFTQTLNVEISHGILRHSPQKGIKGLETVKNVIAVSAAKGGVGKSTIAAHLATLLAQEGAKVGIVDADIYGPSLPKLFGLSGNPDTLDGKRFEPFIRHGVKVMSVGFLVDDKTAMIWRGPMATAALSQLILDTNWGELDYLLVDMPPGTGDIPLTLAQKIPVSGAILITTPQSLSIADVRRGLSMFKKLDIAVLGIIENMSHFICPHCLVRTDLFGKDSVAALAQSFQTQLLGSLPLHSQLAQASDHGEPIAVNHDQHIYNTLRDCVYRAMAILSLRARDYSTILPNVVMAKPTKQ
ncbi:MAG: Mrp/NBP35 family ATP-binding protein [Methylacidiphilales bacterium]|nr:Mrp/NBP35 family ATP-binding protein [Candidatus Methylacidiphilales bacterium]